MTDNTNEHQRALANNQRTTTNTAGWETVGVEKQPKLQPQQFG